MRFYLDAENKRRARGECDELIGDSNIEGSDANGKETRTVYPSVEAARIDKGDMWSGFKYTL